MRKLLPISLLLAACSGGAGPSAPAPVSNYVAGAWPFELPRQHTPRPTTPAITAQDLETRLFLIADDSMRGRESGDIGNAMVTDYIAAEFRRLGLQPAGDNGTYFQTIPLMNGGFEDTPTFTVRGRPLTLWQEYAPLAPAGRMVVGTTVQLTDAPTLYAGQWGDSLLAIDAAKARGAVLVLRAPVNATGGAVTNFWNVREPRLEALQGTIAGFVVVFPRTGMNTLARTFRQSR
jgi:hypothetical protein